MSTFFFADNTVLVSFAHIDRMDLLESLIKDSGRWSHTVRRECRRSAMEEGLESLLQAERILGSPLTPAGNEVQTTFQLRNQMASPGDDRYKHLGEAETLAIMSSRFADSVFLTDDRRARDLAHSLNIDVASTWKLLSLVCRAKLATEMETLDFLKDLRHRGAPVLNGISELRSWILSMSGSA